MLLSYFLGQLCFHQVIRLPDVVLPLLPAETADVLDKHPLVTSDIRRRTHSGRVREFLEFVVLYLEGDTQRSIQRGNTKHLSCDGETQVVSPLNVFSNSRKTPAEIAQRLDIHLSIIHHPHGVYYRQLLCVLGYNPERGDTRIQIHLWVCACRRPRAMGPPGLST